MNLPLPQRCFPCWSKATQDMWKGHQAARPFWLTWLTLLMQSKKALCKDRHEAKHNSSSADILKSHSSTKHQAPSHSCEWQCLNSFFLRSHGFGPFSFCESMCYSNLVTHVATLWATTYSDTLRPPAAKLPTAGGSYRQCAHEQNQSSVFWTKRMGWA